MTLTRSALVSLYVKLGRGDETNTKNRLIEKCDSLDKTAYYCTRLSFMVPAQFRKEERSCHFLIS